MATIGEIKKPDVEVSTQAKTQTPTFIRPRLVPCAVGTAFEVVNVLSRDGAINSKAKYGRYDQLGMRIIQTRFPDPRANIEELNIVESSIRPFLLAGNRLSELRMNPGEAFLSTSHGASRAAIRTKAFGAAGLALDGLTLVFAVDQTVATDTTIDLVVTFEGPGNLTPEQAAEQINAVAGQEFASVVGTAPNAQVEIASTTYGARSSVTIRSGGSANDVLEIGFASGSAAHEERVEGSGYRGQDDRDNDTLTPWIEFYRGDYLLDGVATAFPAKAGLRNIETGVFSNIKAPPVTFGDTGTLPIKPGDQFFTDGARLNGGEIMRVEAARFRVGTVSPTQSQVDSAGRYTRKVYDPVEVRTLFDVSPFAPQYVYFMATGLDVKRVTPTAAVEIGSVAGTAAKPAYVQSTLGADIVSLALAGLKLHYIVTEDGVETEGTLTFTGGPYTAMSQVVDALEGSIPGVLASVQEVSAVDQLRLTTLRTGRNERLVLKADGSANALLGFSASSDTDSDLDIAPSVQRGRDVEFAGLAGTTLSFTFNGNPHVYAVTLLSNSLDEAVAETNEVVGASVASKGGAGAASFRLTSPLKGSASVVEVRATGGAQAIFGLSTTRQVGAGRPQPEAYLDETGALVLSAELLRDQVTGHPLDHTSEQGILYLQYRALRRDVTAVAADARILTLSDVETLEAVLDPITEENPLGLAAFLMMLNAPRHQVKLLGVDEVSAGAPEGTESAWARAAGLLETQEVYAIAPMTRHDAVHNLWAMHVSVVSDAEQKGERIVFINKDLPTREASKVAASGPQSNSTATAGQLLLDANPASGLLTLGVSPLGPLPVSKGVYLEVDLGVAVRRYSIASFTGSLVNLRLAFTGEENVDGFYNTEALPGSVINAAWSVKVRGPALTIPGASPARLDYDRMAEAVAQGSAGYMNERVVSVFPHEIVLPVNGTDRVLPGYYACAMLAGQVASQPAQQGFTNLALTGITGVPLTGPDTKFTQNMLNRIAGGGILTLVQETENGAVTIRHQLTTDVRTKESRELSIIKSLDYARKFYRQGMRRFIGTNNVTDRNFMDNLSMAIEGMHKYLTENENVLKSVRTLKLLQDPDEPDRVALRVRGEPHIPCNGIDMTILV
jgi:hypothetical protein